MNYTDDDIHRSLRRYIAATVNFKVWTEREEVRDAARPIAIVEAAGPTLTTFARASIPQGDISRARPFSVQAYPELADTARESRYAAALIADLLNDTITLGLVEEDTRIGGPRRIPIYDYSGVALAGPGDSRRGPADPYGYADVADGWAVNTIQDPLDHLRFTVTLDLRLTWWAAGRAADGELATSIDGTAIIR